MPRDGTFRESWLRGNLGGLSEAQPLARYWAGGVYTPWGKPPDFVHKSQMLYLEKILLQKLTGNIPENDSNNQLSLKAKRYAAEKPC